MKTADLLVIGALGLGAYMLLNNESAAAAGGSGAGGGIDLSGGDVPVRTVFIENPNDLNQGSTGSSPAAAAVTTPPSVQAAIDSGSLNIFGQPQRTSPPQAPFIETYNAKVAEAVQLTGSPSITSPAYLLATMSNASRAEAAAMQSIFTDAAAAKKTAPAAQAVTKSGGSSSLKINPKTGTYEASSVKIVQPARDAQGQTAMDRQIAKNKAAAEEKKKKGLSFKGYDRNGRAVWS